MAWDKEKKLTMKERIEVAKRVEEEDRRLEELYKKKQVLKSGVVVPGTYLNIYDL